MVTVSLRPYHKGLPLEAHIMLPSAMIGSCCHRVGRRLCMVVCSMCFMPQSKIADWDVSVVMI